MQTKKTLILMAAVFALSSAASVSAGDGTEKVEKKTVIALKTDDFEMAETDISDLEVGESETIVTDSGKIIDLLRTEEGVEVYIDGELLEMGHGDDTGMHSGHKTVHKRVEVICEEGEECEETVWVSDGNDVDIDAFHEHADVDVHTIEDNEKVIVIKKKVHKD